MPQATSAALHWVEQGLVPDHAVRFGIRRLLQQRLTELRAGDPEATAALAQEFLAAMRQSPLAVLPEKANEQHYEVPAAFFGQVLGPHRKYSACWWPEGVTTLAQAEAAALQATCERAGLADGQDVLELGCGWGSLSLWMARRHPHSRITAVSNSHSQRAYIEERARHEGLRNLEVITCDFNDFAPVERFDRVVSIEMFEHLRNYETLFARIGRWLAPEGRLFVHIFCHRALMYPFETEGEGNWMGRHFFTGGLMPSADTLVHCQDALALEERWLLPGTHYQRTANHWLQRQDAQRAEVMAVLRAAYGEDAARWQQRWRMFWMACAELFGYGEGGEWQVAHYRFGKASR